MGCFSSSTTNRDFIPGYHFKGEVYLRDDKPLSPYDLHRHQYASTSFPDSSMKPAIIVYAKNEEDVIQVIKYANMKDIAISVRCGGHQYSGASSTSGPNIQLDVSKTFKDFHYFRAPDGTPRIRSGISFALLEFNEKLGKLGLFIPHGECQNIHIGGHAQSGGYGNLARAFGLFSDHIKEFEIITADGKKKNVNVISDPDLFYAVLGGSPGNFGVLTHIVIQPHRDNDHPHSRGYFGIYLYDADRLKRFYSLTQEFSADQDLPLDFDYTITVVSLNQSFFDIYPNMDSYIRKNHPDIYSPFKEPNSINPSCIFVFAQWANLGGIEQPYNKTVADWFKRIKEAGDGITLQSTLDTNYVNDDVHTPLSKLSKKWIFTKVREYNYPYIKRVYSTRVTPSDNFFEELVDNIDEVQQNITTSNCRISVVMQSYGKNSTVRQNTGNGTSFNWRDCCTTFTCDIFYEVQKGTQSLTYAQKWQERNDRMFIGPSGSFSKQDIRLFWGSYGNRNLNEVWRSYYDSEEKYEKMKEIKSKIDPNKVFSPNEFCIGGPKIIPKEWRHVSAKFN